MTHMIKFIAGKSVRIFSALLWLTPTLIVLFTYSQSALLDMKSFLACTLIYLIGGCLFVLSMKYRAFLTDCPESTTFDVHKALAWKSPINSLKRRWVFYWTYMKKKRLIFQSKQLGTNYTFCDWCFDVQHHPARVPNMDTLLIDVGGVLYPPNS